MRAAPQLPARVPWRRVRWPVALLFACGWLLLAASAAALAPPVQPGRLELDDSMLAHFLDGAADVDIEQVSAPSFAARFRPGARSGERERTGPQWLRITLSADADLRLLEVADLFIDRMRLYLPLPDGGFEVRRAGDLYPFNQREFALRHVLFRIPPHLQGPLIAYLYIESDEAVDVPLVLWRSAALLGATQHDALALGTYYGILLATLLYNFAIFVFLGEAGCLAFVLYLLLYGGLQLCINGLAFQYLWPQSPWIAAHAASLLMGLCIAAAAHFSRRFLDVRSEVPLADRVYRGFIGAGFVLAGWGLFSTGPVTEAVSAGIGLALVAMNLPVGWDCWRRGDQPALYFVVAWAVFLAGVTVSVVLYGGRPLQGSWGEYLVQGGSCVEVLLLSLGLAKRITRLKREKRLAEERVNRYLEGQARELARLVEERTHALREAVESAEAATRELAQKNEQLSRLAAYDGLTDLLNHRSFIGRLQILFGDARRYRFPLSVVMVDLDYFKAVNDAHGHPIGDLALKSVAQVLARGLRTGDIAARYGGEEFALVLPHSEAVDAYRIAERLRLAVAAIRIPECPVLRLTASFGIACLNPGSLELDPDRLLGRADAALYQAKREGRNRVLMAPGDGPVEHG